MLLSTTASSPGNNMTITILPTYLVQLPGWTMTTKLEIQSTDDDEKQKKVQQKRAGDFYGS